MRSFFVIAAFLLTLIATAQDVKPGDELLKNGSFETPDAGRVKAAGWGWGGPIKWASDGKNHWLLEESDKPSSLSADQRVPIEPRFWKLRVSCRVKVTNMAQGAEGWNDARIAMQFQAGDGKMVGQWPNVLHFTGTMADWESHERDYVVPDGARWLSLSCSMFSTTGKVEWDDVSVKLLKFRPVLEDGALPPGVEARWDYESAQKWETPTRAKVCINGLWRFHPVDLKELNLPKAGTGWGYYKVPGSWTPGNSRMTALGPDIWEDKLDLSKTDAAWYQRKITIPAAWAGRRILVNLDNPKHVARVLVDGKEAGKVEWPGGKVDITEAATPGQEHELSIHVLALPLEAEKLLIAREDLIEKVRAEVKFKGLCGDCYLESEPRGPRVEDVFLKPSVREGGLRVACELSGLDPARRYQLQATVRDGEAVAVKFKSAEFAGRQRAVFFRKWEDAKLWDIDQPNLYAASLELLDDQGRTLDVTTPEQFGFREFRIEGRDFLLNGKRIHLRCLDYDNHINDFGLASYPRVRETFKRARSVGFNYVIHGNYDYDSQSFAYIDDTLRAGDDAGFPMSYSIRHVSKIYRDFEKPEVRKDWNRVVDYEVRRVRNHPCVFMWAMDHNFTGWADDQNPARMTGKYEPAPEDDRGLYERRHAATLAEQYVMGLDGTRPCYHHQSGPFNQMITLNCYLNFTPMQDRIEWLSRWAGEGIKPLFFVEFGLPHQASWGGHRTGPFIWGNKVSSEPLVQEFGAMYYGDRAYDLPQYALDHYDTIERVYARHEPFHIWDVLSAYWSNRWEKNFTELKTLHTQQTWPAFRTWGISAILPWDQADLFKPKAGARAKTLEMPTDWAHLQRGGIAPDECEPSEDWLTTTDFDRMEPSSLGQAFLKLNRETLAYIAGPARRFTAKDHLFRQGESVEKQVVIINDLRREAEFGYEWHATVGGKQVGEGKGTVKVAAGDKAMVPVQFTIPAGGGDASGRIELTGMLEGKPDETLQDSFDFTVLAPAPKITQTAKIALYDPKGLTAKLLREAGLRCETVNAPVAPPGCGLLIIGREAITLDGPGVDVEALAAQGTNVLIFEQTEEVLQRRWGFRTASPGTRRAFVRRPRHPACAGLNDEVLRDWRGSSTLVEAYPEPQGYHRDYPSAIWCGFNNTRTWKWGNYGSVASVVLEKPQRGNFSALLDCEFDLQYTPLLEWYAARGRAIFCQMDLSGRDMPEPAAERLLANLLNYAQEPEAKIAGAHAPRSLQGCRYVGSKTMAKALTELGADMSGSGAVAVIGPGANAEEAKAAAAQAETVICLGLDGKTLSAILPFEVQTEERWVAVTPLSGREALGALAGLGSADFHWRAKMPVQCITQALPGFPMLSTGIFAQGEAGGKRYVFMQSTPPMFDGTEKPQLKRTWRHSLATLARVLTNCGVALKCPLGERLMEAPPMALDLSGTWRFVSDPQKKLKAEEVAGLDFDAAGWRELKVPGYWEEQLADLKSYDGIAWYRKEFTLKAPPPEGVELILGAVDDEDWTYLNGQLIGHIGQETNPDDYWSAERRYKLPAGLLRAGRNVIAVKVNDLRQSGGIAKGPVGIFEPGRWLGSYYLDQPTALDDPYRYNRW